MSERFELPAELTIYTAMETRNSLLAWAAEHGAKAGASLKVSARDVGSVDGAGLQLLAALSNMEQGWQLVETSDAFVEACRLMGLEHWLDSPYLHDLKPGAAV